MGNVDPEVVRQFGREWSRFDQSQLPPEESARSFAEYFSVFPWEELPPSPRGFDLGCGSGRWAQHVAPRVAELHCIDPSAQALEVAKRNLAPFANCRFHLAGVDAIPLPDGAMDFGYSLGVLHHVPDTAAAIRSCVAKLKPGAPLLLYLYYAFDHRSWWFRAVWRTSDLLRRVLCRAPAGLRYLASQLIAGTVYWPLARAARLLERRGIAVESLPLSAYRDKSFYTLRTDALDRFGTRLERRFTRGQIEAMMRQAGLEGIKFREVRPHWCAVGHRARGAERDAFRGETTNVGMRGPAWMASEPLTGLRDLCQAPNIDPGQQSARRRGRP